MAPQPLTPDRILEATEEVLRRHGPAKATVVDVARALGVSHGSVYRHFPSKTALREAVTARWLDQSHAELADVAAESGPAPERLTRWLTALFTFKRRKAGCDPELFATYVALTGEHSEVVAAHITTLTGHLARIIADGVAAGDFSVDDPATAARAVWDATVRFHDPAHAADWSSPSITPAFTAVCALALRGLGFAPPRD
ncbi:MULTISPECIES: TetR family transcriptional regulator [Streptomycetaceae]|uniref:TetR-family transcriptional regulator n=1 Tax=Streptantibioticus cattleyicolor (strain ATCC 35852 / DSM 46488 / JCM 4925 / NBRC 14057 / NRRL 8057) TaxID=1003195 RepID=F8JNZ9_STREN|nr:MULTISPECIES: TetR family transcriptional regulator [Streptomycetaceae]AEW93940.1 TetR-family transcriptional regulator [Streptantibioticus cattleyicolor NRRL 8057 = DSM 46488]MYS58616.1 TetR family transcriptional regulator [Streptomyces sp. SID5468]CCB74286.1 TetR-family transcriptional regulator [Streptantibioticus cattleyicolor NRRL 8057 = DSM 46488]